MNKKNKNITPSSSKRRFLRVLGFSALSASAVGFWNLNTNKNNLKVISWEGTTLGAPTKIEIHHKDETTARRILSEITIDIAKYEKLFSLYREDSQLSLLNKNSIITNADDELINLIQSANKISAITSGAFDITVQPLWNLYSKHFFEKQNLKPPEMKKIIEAKNLVNWKNIKIEENTILLKKPNMSLTLNGIAQGWITDLVKDKLKKNGINNVLVDMGETYGLGKYEGKRPWRIAIEGSYGLSGTVELVNKAIATSGGYGTVFETTSQYHHIFDPATGLSANKHEAVSVVSDNAWIADALSTAGLSMKRNFLSEVSKKLNCKTYLSNKTNLELI